MEWKNFSKSVEKQTKDVLRELMEKADLKQGQIAVVGCSSSEREL